MITTIIELIIIMITYDSCAAADGHNKVGFFMIINDSNDNDPTPHRCAQRDGRAGGVRTGTLREGGVLC